MSDKSKTSKRILLRGETDKRVRVLFIIRVCLWVGALAATIYWIVWSFRVYELGYYDPYEYAGVFRPIFWKGFLTACGCIAVSLILRTVSDKIKKENDRKRIEYESQFLPPEKKIIEAEKRADK